MGSYIYRRIQIKLLRSYRLVEFVRTFAYLDDSLRVRFPNRYPPVVVLAAGLAVLTLAVLVAVLR